MVDVPRPLLVQLQEQAEEAAMAAEPLRRRSYQRRLENALRDHPKTRAAANMIPPAGVLE